MREWPVSVDSSSGVVIPQEHGAWVVCGCLDPIGDFCVLEPVFDEVAEGWDVDSSPCFARGCDEWFVWSCVGSGGAFAFVFSPVTGEDVGVWAGLAGEEFGALPEGFDADCCDVFVVVGDGSVGGVAPGPTGGCAFCCGVVAAAGVDHEGGGVFDFGAHADGGEAVQAGHCSVLLCLACPSLACGMGQYPS